jgi:hypothetical protein
MALFSQHYTRKFNPYIFYDSVHELDFLYDCFIVQYKIQMLCILVLSPEYIVNNSKTENKTTKEQQQQQQQKKALLLISFEK